MLPKFPGSKPQQFSLWPLRSAPGSLGTYGFLTPPYGLPYGLELKNNPRLCTSLRVYASNTPQEAATLIFGALPHKCGVPASLDRGRDGPKATPPSEPDWRVFRHRLSRLWAFEALAAWAPAK